MMSPEGVFVLVAFAVWAIVQYRRDAAAARREAERGMALPFERESADPQREHELQTRLGPLPSGLSLGVRAYRWSLGKGRRIVVAGLSPRLTIGPGRPGVFNDGDVDVGSADFDSTFNLLGPPAFLRAVMDAPTRGALLNLARLQAVRGGSLAVSGGELRIDVPGDREGAETVEDVARAALEAAAHLREPTDLAARLSAIACGDADAGIRLRSLQTLTREWPTHEQTLRAVREAAAGGDPELRLEAGRALRDEGRPVLLALARDEAVEDGCSARAVDALRPVKLVEVTEALAAALRPLPGTNASSRPHTARACLEALEQSADPAAVPLLAEALRSRQESIAPAAIRALARVGTAEVVLPLMEAISEQGGEVRRLAARALADVQSGLTGAPGEVSLSEGDAGQVSLADDPGGRVSIARPPIDDDE